MLVVSYDRFQDDRPHCHTLCSSLFDDENSVSAPAYSECQLGRPCRGSLHLVSLMTPIIIVHKSYIFDHPTVLTTESMYEPVKARVVRESRPHNCAPQSIARSRALIIDTPPQSQLTHCLALTGKRVAGEKEGS